MDVAYDHIQEEILASSGHSEEAQQGESSSDPTTSASAAPATQQPNLDLTAEFQDTFRAISTQPWGARLGGLWNNVRRQGESYYEEARQEYTAVSQEASKGFTDLKESLIGRTRGLSLGGGFSGQTDDRPGQADDGDRATVTPSSPTDGDKAAEAEASDEGFISRFKSEASKRLKDIEKAEDAADEALLKFGTNLRNFLRDAVSIAPPDASGGEDASSNGSKVLFESKNVDGKRVIHTTRFEAQLHAIHSSLENFSKDPLGDEWEKWKSEFDIDKKTDDIAADLETYPELRRTMEALVPETIEYGDFWRRYYFLRLAIETEEKRRKELLSGMLEFPYIFHSLPPLMLYVLNTVSAANGDDEEEVAWDEDSDSDVESPPTPQGTSKKPISSAKASNKPEASSSTNNDSLRPAESRRSNDQGSQAGSDASYDLVSGAASHAPGSPKEKQSSPAGTGDASKTDDSDEEDWE
ncbi:hypothetical protein FQN57_000591 [Myotisia sp. PD_48]|nr:hypothetical protein FQN57_000591 [Myotisia sp. PD_48]